MFREYSAFFNKDYRDKADGSFLYRLQRSFLDVLLDGYPDKKKPEHVYYADDCFVVFRNLGFLKDHHFQRALRDSGVDQVILGRVWRVWTLACTMQSRWQTAGAIVDCGTYNGCALEVSLAYCLNVLGKRVGPVVACDLFEDPPAESRKVEHGPLLHQRVESRLKKYENVTVLKGLLPDALYSEALGPITWCQIDLNSAEADAATFEFIYENLASGAVVIFDDYGFSRYQRTQERLDEFLSSKGQRILELPTGQGLYIHP